MDAGGNNIPVIDRGYHFMIGKHYSTGDAGGNTVINFMIGIIVQVMPVETIFQLIKSLLLLQLEMPIIK